MEISMMKYELDNNIDDLMIKFPIEVIPPTYYGEIETPSDIPTMVRQKTDSTGKTVYIDIVNPKAFMESSEFDGFEIDGVNVKKAILNFKY